MHPTAGAPAPPFEATPTQLPKKANLQPKPEGVAPLAPSHTIYELKTAAFRALEPWPWANNGSAEGGATRDRGGAALREPNALQSAASLPRTWRANKTIYVNQSHLSVSELSRDAQFAFVVSELDVTLRLFNIKTGKLLARTVLPDVKTFEGFDAIFWPEECTPCGEKPPSILLGTHAGLRLIQAETGAVLEKLSPMPTEHLKLSNDRKLLVAASSQIPAQTSQLVIYRVAPQSPRLTPVLLASFEERVDDWALSTSGKLLAVTYYPSDRLEVFDLERQVSRFSVPAPRYANSVAFSADESWIAVGGERLQVVSVDDPAERAEFSQFGNNIDHVRFNATTGQWFTSSYDGKIRVFSQNMETHELRLTQTLSHLGTANVYALSFSADEQVLLSSSGDKTLKVWKY
ncbi:MAG: hypothetical protein SFV15_04580 [Polyangiaceae bacterium]|nr:hypothetical protein [Polyangiaceae bacterium]